MGTREQDRFERIRESVRKSSDKKFLEASRTKAKSLAESIRMTHLHEDLSEIFPLKIHRFSPNAFVFGSDPNDSLKRNIVTDSPDDIEEIHKSSEARMFFYYSHGNFLVPEKVFDDAGIDFIHEASVIKTHVANFRSFVIDTFNRHFLIYGGGDIPSSNIYLCKKDKDFMALREMTGQKSVQDLTYGVYFNRAGSVFREISSHFAPDGDLKMIRDFKNKVRIHKSRTTLSWLRSKAEQALSGEFVPGKKPHFISAPKELIRERESGIREFLRVSRNILDSLDSEGDIDSLYEKNDIENLAQAVITL